MDDQRITQLLAEIDQFQAALHDPGNDMDTGTRMELVAALQDLEVDLRHFREVRARRRHPSGDD